jgi:hypothetical protein
MCSFSVSTNAVAALTQAQFHEDVCPNIGRWGSSNFSKRRIGTRVLTNKGYKVFEACTGEQCKR